MKRLSNNCIAAMLSSRLLGANKPGYQQTTAVYLFFSNYGWVLKTKKPSYIIIIPVILYAVNIYRFALHLFIQYVLSLYMRLFGLIKTKEILMRRLIVGGLIL